MHCVMGKKIKSPVCKFSEKKKKTTFTKVHFKLLRNKEKNWI